MRIIGINGFKEVGKDTVGQFIYESSPERFKRVSFADKMKIAAARSLGFEATDEKLIYAMNECKSKSGWMFEIRNDFFSKTFTGREYLQWFGGNMREVLGNEIWIDQVLPHPHSIVDDDGLYEQEDMLNLRAMYPDLDGIYIPDVRYANEAQRILEFGGEIWNVQRPGFEGDGHASEQELPSTLIDHRINNDSDLEHLRKEVSFLLE